MVNAVCRRGRNQAAWTLRYLITHESDFTYIHVGTVKKIRMVSFANAVKLLMLLPGRLAQANRSKFAQTLYQYYAGDAKLKAEIDRNAGSSEWIHVLAREALAAERLGSAELDHAQPATGEVYRRLYDACSSAAVPSSAVNPASPTRPVPPGPFHPARSIRTDRPGPLHMACINQPDALGRGSSLA